MNTVTRETGLLRDGLFHQGKGSPDLLDKEQLERDPKGYGLKLLKENKGSRAIVALSRAVEQAPEDLEARVALGRAFCAGYRWADGLPHLHYVLERQPDHYEARYLVADSLLQFGRYREAAEQWRIALRHFPLWPRLKAAFWKLVKPRRFLHRGISPSTNDPAVKLAYVEARCDDIDFAGDSVQTGKPNSIWIKSARGRRMRLRNVPLVRSSTKLFTMGSCFALEIRHALLRRGFQVWPKILDLEFDHQKQIVNLLPDEDDLSHFDTFAIRQEFEQAFAGTHYAPTDFWQVSGQTINKVMKCETVWQDPYRRNIFATDLEGIQDVSRKLDDRIREGIMAADVYVITLGLIETWRLRSNGLHACAYPGVGGGGGDREADLHVASFQENYENIKRVCELVFSRFPDRHIILTVSPVGLERTFRSEQDIVVANMESKSTLRTVAGQICREFPQVHYLPTYELFLYHDLFADDGRHTARDGVERAIELFGKCFFDTAEPEAKH